MHSATKVALALAVTIAGSANAARLDDGDLLARRCAAGIAEQMPYLEPVGEFVDVGEGVMKGERAVRVKVRLSDSFRADAVGVVECEVNPVSRNVRVTKIRR